MSSRPGRGWRSVAEEMLGALRESPADVREKFRSGALVAPTPEDESRWDAEEMDLRRARYRQRVGMLDEAMVEIGVSGWGRRSAGPWARLSDIADPAIRESVVDSTRKGCLYLWGAPGRGKTFIGAAAVRERLRLEAEWASLEEPDPTPEPLKRRDFGFHVRWCSMRSMLQAIRDAQFGEERASIAAAVGRWSGASFLVIDEFGTTAREELSDYESEFVFQVMDARCARHADPTSKAGTVVTSNDRLRAATARLGEHGERMVSRMAGAFQAVQVDGQDRRVGR